LRGAGVQDAPRGICDVGLGLIAWLARGPREGFAIESGSGPAGSQDRQGEECAREEVPCLLPLCKRVLFHSVFSFLQGAGYRL